MLGQGDLDDALAGAGALGEDVQNQRGAIDDLDTQPLLQRALLGGGEFVVEDRDRSSQFVAQIGDLLQLALADVRARIGWRSRWATRAIGMAPAVKASWANSSSDASMFQCAARRKSTPTRMARSKGGCVGWCLRRPPPGCLLR